MTSQTTEGRGGGAYKYRKPEPGQKNKIKAIEAAQKKKALVLSLWDQGEDTADIARRAHLPEADVYAITNDRPRKLRREPYRTPYAGKGTS